MLGAPMLERFPPLPRSKTPAPGRSPTAADERIRQYTPTPALRTQREVISRRDDAEHSAAYIRAASGMGGSCEFARQPAANLPGSAASCTCERKARGAVFDVKHSGRILNHRDRDYVGGRRKTAISFSATIWWARPNNRPSCMAPIR